MEEAGTVIAVSNGQATIAMEENAACGSCSQKSTCHPGDGAQRTMTAQDPIGVKPGQVVTVDLPGGGVWLAMGLAYGVPLALLLVGAILGFRMAPEGADREVYSALSALAGLVAGFLLLARFRGRYEGRASLKPVVIRIGR